MNGLIQQHLIKTSLCAVHYGHIVQEMSSFNCSVILEAVVCSDVDLHCVTESRF